MVDKMNALIQHSKYEGTLFLQPVAGDISGRREAENNAVAGAGQERTMYAYAPKSGCPHPKQCQVLMVLRDGTDEASAKAVMEKYHLDALAEEKNFLLLFPNPVGQGWNYNDDAGCENDMDYLVRCFGVLKGSELGVSGFNGMVFYLADSEAASAMLMTMAAKKPLNVPAMMIGAFPQEYAIPADALNVEVAAFVSDNAAAAAYIQAANGVSSEETADGVTTYFGKNPNCRLLVTDRPIDAQTVAIAWERLFSESRRWQNDTYGCYQKRTNFTEKGFVGHVKDTSLGCNDGYGQTWYEYIPPQLRGTQEKVPLLFYFHGGGCVPLYGAEQSDWHEIADKENFIVVYPEASQKNMWNAWDDKTLLRYSDKAFFLALIEHMKQVHPIDESRIYVSGFSMGGMMSNAMACSLPNVVAAAAPCNAFNEGYFSSYAIMDARLKKPGEKISMLSQKPSETRKAADAKKTSFDYIVPVIQTAGLIDGKWPIDSAEDPRLKTFDYWKAYNHLHTEPFVQNQSNESGITSDEQCYEGEDERFLHHSWHNAEGDSLYELLLAKRCPHALDIRTHYYTWKFLKKFSRNPNGTLHIEK